MEFLTKIQCWHKKLFRWIIKSIQYSMFLWQIGDEDYDYCFILEVLNYKIKRTRLHILKHNIISDAQIVANQMKEVEDLIDAYLDDDFLPKMQEAFEEKWGEFTEKGFFAVFHMKRKNAITPELRAQAKQEQRDIYKAQNNKREEVWNKIFSLLNENLRNWWD